MYHQVYGCISQEGHMKQREPIVKHIFTADPSAHVFDDRIYIYPSHDLPHDGEDDDEGGEYLMEDYHVLSMDAPDQACTDHGEALHIRDVPWARTVAIAAPAGPIRK